jgi:hypothetical protein
VKLGQALCLSSWLALSNVAIASEGLPFSRVALLLPGCDLPGLGSGQLRDAAALELQGEGLALAAPGELAPQTDVLVIIEATCPADGEVTLSAEYAGQRHERRVELSELAHNERARALSLSLAELLAAFRHDPSPAPSASQSAAQSEPTPAPMLPVEAKPGPAAAPENTDGARPIDRTERASVGGGLAAELRLFEGALLWGARAQVERSAWSASADVLAGKTSVAAGDVTSVLVQMNVAHYVRLLGRPEAALVTGGPRAGAGVATFVVSEGPSARGASALDFYLDAAISARLSLRTGDAWRWALAAEVGYARGPVGRADGVEVTRSAGLFTSLLVGASVVP